MKSRLHALIHLLCSAKIIFWLTPLLMVLLVIGTVAQKYIGLYEAQRIFFFNPIIWWGVIPLPGTTLLLGVILVGLCTKFIFKSQWTWKRSGVNLSHLGVLILLLGGLITMLYKEEGAITLFDNDTSNQVVDYYERELVITKNDRVIGCYDFDHLTVNRVITFKDYPMQVTILDACQNCAIEKRSSDQINESLRSMARAVFLKEKPLELLAEQNLSGVTFRISGVNKKQDGTYVTFDVMPKPISVGDYKIYFSKAKRDLPFHVKLVSFQTIYYPGTTKAKDFRSDVVIQDGSVSWPARIEMNTPLRYKGYSFYQSSVVEDSNGDTGSVLAVVKNTGWLFPYLGTILLSIGLLIHTCIALFKKRNRVGVVLLAVFLLGVMPHATLAKPLDFAGFGRLPILHEGRVKPLDSFARTELRHYTDDAVFNDLPADHWLARVLFEPDKAIQDRLFTVRNKAIRQQLRLDHDTARAFDAMTLLNAMTRHKTMIETLLNTPDDDLTPDQIELRDLYTRVTSYLELLGSMTVVLPLQDDATQRSYRALYQDKTALQTAIRAVVHKKGEDLARYTPQELMLVNLGMRMDALGKTATLSHTFKIIPRQGDWFTPWASLDDPALVLWEKLAKAYLTNDSTKWDHTIDALVQHNTDNAQISPFRLHLEQFYRHIRALSVTEGLYVLSLLLFVFSSLRPNVGKWIIPSAALATLFHATSIAMRVIILDRPPVGTLYESILFVSLITSITALVITHVKKDTLYLVGGLTLSLILLLIAPTFNARGDSMEVLVAVLNTNFWLATHVVIITAAYGVCLVAATLAHILLYKRHCGITHDSQEILLHRLSLVALFLTTFGTLLGGVWADQSWGRFWGWDPKENGALLIMLWLIWVVHGRISGHIISTKFIAAIAALGMIVALSWFGVNLLSVGLHSYGFTSGIAGGLGLFVVLDVALITYFMRRSKR